ncbi:MAG: hypothetical protein LCH80_12995 [Proteobacteria bacterium]|nr:hypothetical protein [Pseudomonadota bacterium]
MSNEHDASPWDEQQASLLVEATVLIGLTWLNGEGTPEYEQMFGVITTADARRGFEVALKGMRTGETYWLPPDTRNFQAAPPGEYRLKSTGEVVIDPDFTSTWTINPPLN